MVVQSLFNFIQPFVRLFVVCVAFLIAILLRFLNSGDPDFLGSESFVYAIKTISCFLMDAGNPPQGAPVLASAVQTAVRIVITTLVQLLQSVERWAGSSDIQ